MQIDPKHLIQFATIIECGSFTLAAEKLFTTQPALSKMVKNLEEVIGSPLLEQRRRPVIASEIGLLLARKGQDIRMSTKAALSLAEETKSGYGGTVKVGAPPFFCEQVLSNVVVRFRQMYPGIVVEIMSGYRDEMAEKVTRGELDFAVGAITDDFDRSTLQFEVLSYVQHAVVCRASHPIMNDADYSSHRLEKQTWISHSQQSILYKIMRSDLTKLGLKSFVNVVTSESSLTLMRILKATDNLTVLPVFATLEGVKDGELSMLPIDMPLDVIPFGLINHINAVTSAAAKNLQQLVVNEMRNIDVEVLNLMASFGCHHGHYKS